MRKDAGLKAAGSGLMSRREAAKYIGVAEQTLAVWKCNKRVDIPVIQVGRLIKYRRADLDRFLNANTMEIHSVATKPKTKVSEFRPKEVAPTEPSIGFAQVQVVEQSPRKRAKAESSATELEVVLPSGITLRLAAGGSLEFLSSVIAALENP